MSTTRVGALMAMPIPVLSAMRERLTSVLRPDQADPGIGHVHLGPGHVEPRPRAHLEEALGAAQVQVGPIQRLGIDDDQAAREQQVVVGLLHGQRDEVLLKLHALARELAIGLGRVGGRPVLPEVEEKQGGGDGGGGLRRHADGRRLSRLPGDLHGVLLLEAVPLAAELGQKR